MSTYIFITCRTCDQHSGEVNGAGPFMAQCLAARDRARELVGLADTFSFTLQSTDYPFILGEHPILFLSRHQGHELDVEDEYGRVYDEAGVAGPFPTEPPSIA